jgi:hypothetical protein
MLFPVKLRFCVFLRRGLIFGSLAVSFIGGFGHFNLTFMSYFNFFCSEFLSRGLNRVEGLTYPILFQKCRKSFRPRTSLANVHHDFYFYL